MTETELNRKLAELADQNNTMPPSWGREYRRLQRTKHYARMHKIVTRSYIPHVGYVQWTFDGSHFVPTGKYIKYPKNSNCQQWIKRETSKRTRRCKELPAKGNHYRHLFDYWWTLY